MPTMSLMLLTGAAGLMAPAALQQRVEAFAGQAALVDPRLLLPACVAPEFAWAPGGRSVVVHCPAPEWRVFVPVGAGGSAGPTPVAAAQSAAEVPAVRRGDRVTLELGGDGFVIDMEAVAESDSRDGRVALRALAGGRRLYGHVGDDGRVRLQGARTMVNGR